MLRVLVVDDESLARLRLKALLLDCRDKEDQPLAQVIDEAADATTALAALARRAVDLVLLDISMPGVDGLGLAAQIRQTCLPPPLIIFVTAHAQHAVQAFELEAADYLTKPVRRDRLQDALLRATQRRAAEQAWAQRETHQEEPLIVTDRGRIERVSIEDVIYLKAELKYVTLRTADRTHVLDASLADLEERLGDRMIRIHRNALVARSAVRALERRPGLDGAAEEGSESWAVRVAPVDEWLVVSRRQLAAVREAIASFSR